MKTWKLLCLTLILILCIQLRTKSHYFSCYPSLFLRLPSLFSLCHLSPRGDISLLLPRASYRKSGMCSLWETCRRSWGCAKRGFVTNYYSVRFPAKWDILIRIQTVDQKVMNRKQVIWCDRLEKLDWTRDTHILLASWNLPPKCVFISYGSESQIKKKNSAEWDANGSLGCSLSLFKPGK